LGVRVAAPSPVPLSKEDFIRGLDPCPSGDAFRWRPFVVAALIGLAAAGSIVQALPGAGFDRDPSIRAYRSKADAFVSEATPRRNFGRARQLIVDASPTVSTYLRFDVDLRSVDISHISLLLYSRSRSRTGYQVQLVSGRWKERAINFLNAPELLPPSVASGPLRARAWKAVDVMSLVVPEKGASFALTTESQTRAVFTSRETGFHGPRLVVELQPNDTTRSTTTGTGVSPQPPPP
jgi:hypothetical protein